VSALTRNNVQIRGSGERAMVFAHGFGCDQNMWRFVSPAFKAEFRTVLFDHVGAGGSDLTAFEPAKYASLSGYADDVVEIGRELGLRGAAFVGHSVAAMIGVLASQSGFALPQASQTGHPFVSLTDHQSCRATIQLDSVKLQAVQAVVAIPDWQNRVRAGRAG
jgi:pimeloyl-ACP methyl ester carboxylesterase